MKPRKTTRSTTKNAKTRSDSRSRARPAAPFASVALLERTGRHLAALQLSISELRGEGEHISTIKETARVAQAIVAVTGELRAHEKLAILKRDSLRPEEVLEWFRALPEDQQAGIMREMNAMTENESVLS